MIDQTVTPSPSLGQSIQLYMRMARPSQLLSILLVYSWGVAIGLSRVPGFSAAVFFAGLLPLLLISASIHYANEYADVGTDALTVRTPFSGGSGALGDFDAPRTVALRAAWIALIAGLALAAVALPSGLLSPAAFLLLLSAAYLLLFLQRGTLLPAPVLPGPVFWGSLLVLPTAVWAGLAYTRQHSPFPSVFSMVLLLLVQSGGWLAYIAGAGGF